MHHNVGTVDAVPRRNQGSSSKIGGSAVIRSCIIEFDGVSHGTRGSASARRNLMIASGTGGPGGAGAILRSENGNVLYRFREGLGIRVTPMQAEWAGLILGMKQGIRKGYHHVTIKGDCEDVINQFRGIGRCLDLMFELREAMLLKGDFHSCTLQVIPRELNTEADALANEAINLPGGVVQEEEVA